MPFRAFSIAARNSTALPETHADLPRRAFLSGALGLAAGTVLLNSPLAALFAAQPSRMTLCLTPGSIGVQLNQMEALAAAAKHGFEAVEPYAGFLAGSEADFEEIGRVMKTAGLVWGASSLSVDFRQEDARFKQGMAGLPRLAKALEKFGATRVGTWISPSHPSLTYAQNMKRHASRLREIAAVLKLHGLRLGLEYVGTHTLLTRNKYPFIHTLAETRDLIETIGEDNVGFVLDSWHWWQAGDSAEEIEALANKEVISVDLNDAPAGVEKRQQLDNQRELPGATGVIPIEPFLKALARIGYDGPVRAEPFNKALQALPNQAALIETARAMKRALSVVRPAP